MVGLYIVYSDLRICEGNAVDYIAKMAGQTSLTIQYINNRWTECVHY